MKRSIQQSAVQSTFDFDTLIDLPVELPKLHIVQAQPQKYCTKCQKTKNVSCFPKNRNNHDGLHAWCSDCNKVACSERYQIRKKSKEKIPSKQCALCRQHKPLDQFSPHDLANDDLQSLCNECLDVPTSEIMSSCKKCTKCHNWLPFDKFSKSRKSRDGLSWWCKACKSKRDKDLPKEHWRKKRCKKYVTPDQYNEMFEAQGGLCAACGNPETSTGPNGNIRALSVDHNHDTGQVRALLCSACNTSYGLLQEDPERILGLLAYHQKWNPE